MSEPSLLITQFTVPPVRARLLPRADLIDRLNKSCALPLVLLSACAGFGKTTLLAAGSVRTESTVWLGNVFCDTLKAIKILSEE